MSEAFRDTLTIVGASNFRSLGGLPTAGGRRIRPHALMRADRLSGLSTEDWEQLAGAGLATVCDLRSESERAEHPNAIPERLRVREVRCDVLNDLRADPSLARLLLDDPTPRGAERLMIELYRRLPEHMARTMRTLVDLLLDEGAPLLIHCSAGKDRTGFAVAMLLRSLEVPDELIVADYLESRAWPGREGHRASLSRRLAIVVPESNIHDVVSTVLDVREAYLAAALEAMAEAYGSVERYLEAEAGLDATRRARLHERLLA